MPLTEHIPEVHVPAVVLSDEQRAVLNMVKKGGNVFFTGSAGKNTDLFRPRWKLSFCRDRKVRPTSCHH